MASADDATIKDHDRADGDFALLLGFRGFAKGLAHE
jgi:hypothetical protein